MKRTELSNKFLKHKTDKSRQAFVKQRNYYVYLERKSKTNYYSSLNLKDITDNEKFWKTRKLLFSNKKNLKKTIKKLPKIRMKMSKFLMINSQKLDLCSKFQNQTTSNRSLG